ncbi:MAG: hypothetical protein WCJ01_08990 [Ignavibacteria bacterium]
MELHTGQLIRYHFPSPVSQDKEFITGSIIEISESFIKVKTESDTILKISFKNFEYIKTFETSNN